MRGLNSKTTEFLHSSYTTDFDFIALSETWLHKGVNDCELFNHNYVVYRKGRDFLKTNTTKGGGVIPAVKN